MSQTNTNNNPPGNGLIKLDTSDTAGHLDPREFVPVEWQLDVRAAKLMTVPFKLYVGGRWLDGSAGDYIIFGALGEVAIVSGLNFPQLCRLQTAGG